jgi:hypothetical protein
MEYLINWVTMGEELPISTPTIILFVITGINYLFFGNIAEFYGEKLIKDESNLFRVKILAQKEQRPDGGLPYDLMKEHNSSDYDLANPVTRGVARGDEMEYMRRIKDKVYEYMAEVEGGVSYVRPVIVE